MLTEFDEIQVPTNLVNAAISQGVAKARPARRRRHLIASSVVALAAVGLLAAVTPAAIQAGGIVPAYQQLLDQSSTNTEHWDPTLNQLLGDFASTNVYQPLHAATQVVNGISVKPIGTMASAGVSAVIVDYSGPGIDPSQLDQQSNIAINQMDEAHGFYDIEANGAKVKLGHYRQVIAWYPSLSDGVDAKAFDLRLGKVNGTTHSLNWQKLALPQFHATTRSLAQQYTASVFGGTATVALTQVHTSGQSLVLQYQTSFDPKQLSAEAQRWYQEAAWVSTGRVYRNDHLVGYLALGVGGNSLAITHNNGLVQANYQSTFATNYYDHENRSVALKAGDVVKFEYELPAKGDRQKAATFTVPAEQLLP